MAKSEYVLFRVAIALGLLLGLGLLVETVETYRYVSGNLIRQEAQKEAQRKTIALERAARAAKATEADDARLTPSMTSGLTSQLGRF